jgi:prephenate dehydratase
VGQSQIFLAENEDVTITEYKNTSSCSKIVAEGASGTLAVIAGPAIAKTYNPEVLNDNVDDVKQNFITQLVNNYKAFFYRLFG